MVVGGRDVELRQTQMLKGLLDLCVLAVLIEEPTYGYGLVSALERRGFELVSEGSVYPLLARLEKAGLVVGVTVPSPDGPRRKYYEATDDGRAALEIGRQAWSTVRSQVDDVLVAGTRGPIGREAR